MSPSTTGAETTLLFTMANATPERYGTKGVEKCYLICTVSDSQAKHNHGDQQVELTEPRLTPLKSSYLRHGE